MDDRRIIVNTALAPEADVATSQAVVLDKLVFVSGQTGKNPDDLRLPGDFASQMKNAMYNIRAILEAAKSDFINTLRVTIYLSDAYYYDEMESIYKFFFPTKDPPTREVVIVSSLPKGALVQISVIAGLRSSF